MDNELASIRKSLRFIKVYALLMTVLFTVMAFSGFTQSAQKNVEEITAKRIRIVDPAGKLRVILGSNLENVNRVGLLFYNEEGTESGALVYSGKRDKDGKIEAFSLLTMDQFKSDQIVVLDYDHTGDRKRYGLTINDRPDALSAQADEIIRELGQALKASRSIRKVVGRNGCTQTGISVTNSSQGDRRAPAVCWPGCGRLITRTLSDPDGKPRLRLQVDKLGKASITFLDPSGRTLRTIKP